MDSIFIRNMQFYGYHGVYPEETVLGQRFLVSIMMYADLKGASVQDDLSLTVNYAEVYNIVKTIVEGTPFKLLESVAERVVGAVLTDFPILSRVVVRIEKPGAPIAGVFSDVGVEIDRSRRVAKEGYLCKN